MARRFQFSLRDVLAMIVLTAVGVSAINAVGNYTRWPMAIVLLELCGTCIGLAVGMTVRRPLLFGGVGAALILPVVIVARGLVDFSLP